MIKINQIKLIMDVTIHAIRRPEYPGYYFVFHPSEIAVGIPRQ